MQLEVYKKREAYNREKEQYQMQVRQLLEQTQAHCSKKLEQTELEVYKYREAYNKENELFQAKWRQEQAKMESKLQAMCEQMTQYRTKIEDSLENAITTMCKEGKQEQQYVKPAQSEPAIVDSASSASIRKILQELDKKMN